MVLIPLWIKYVHLSLSPQVNQNVIAFHSHVVSSRIRRYPQERLPAFLFWGQLVACGGPADTELRYGLYSVSDAATLVMAIRFEEIGYLANSSLGVEMARNTLLEGIPSSAVVSLAGVSSWR